MYCLFTSVVSLDASLSTGMMNKKKKRERIANPFKVRAYAPQSVISDMHRVDSGEIKANHYSVIPCEYCKLIKSSNQIPPRSDVAGYENRKCENREGVHELFPIAGASL